MILPDNLHPLPVSSDEAGRHAARDSQGFVNETEVRHLLVGPLAYGRQTTCYHGADGSFAGRVEESPFVSLAADEAYDEAPAKAFGVSAESAEVRRAAPPRPRGSEDRAEAPRSRPWVVSAAMLMIGVIVGSAAFTLREPFAPEPPAPMVPSATHPGVPAEDGPSLASADAPMP